MSKNKKLYRLKNLFSGLGPGVITGASDDDPSGILTYLQAGAIMGFKSLWMALLTLPLMYGIQEMCARIGFVTKKGLIKIIKENFSPLVLYPLAFISVIVIIINLGADLLAIGVVLESLFDVSRIFWLVISSLTVLLFTIFLSYRRFASLLKWLAFFLLFYVIAVFCMQVNWQEALLHTFWPVFAWNKNSVMILTAILGTTISPYLFFWQTSEEVEEREEKTRERHLKRFIVTKHELKDLKKDTFWGMFFSNFVTWFIIAGAAQMAASHGLKEITSFDDAALVLKPLLGNFAYLIFSLGIIGTGFLTVPVLGGCVGYILSEIFNFNEGMNKTFRQAKGFYLAIALATILGMLLSVFKINPIQLLIYTAVLYTLITPFIILVILKIGNDKKILKNNINSKRSNFLGVATLLLTLIAVVSYFISILN